MVTWKVFYISHYYVHFSIEIFTCSVTTTVASVSQSTRRAFPGPNSIFLIPFLQITGYFSYKLNPMCFLIYENLKCLCFQKSKKFEFLVMNFVHVKETSGPKSFRGSLRNARLVRKVFFFSLSPQTKLSSC